MPNQVLLLVDDDADIRESLQLVLEDMGYRVRIAENGKDALENLKLAPKPDIIVTDLMMPVMNGFEFLQALREHPKFGGIPIVVMSANRGYDASDLKVHEMIRKPFEIADLARSLHKAVS